MHKMTLALALCLGGCAVGPDYRQPQTTVDAQFANSTAADYSADEASKQFWTEFQEPLLTKLVEQALTANKDLEIARANLQASRAARGLTQFDLFPTVTAGASRLKVKQSEHQLPNVPASAREFDDVDAGFDASWELDLFGRVRRGVEAARAEEQAAIAQLRDAQVTVTAEVARNYFVLRGLQDQLGVAVRNSENQRQTLSLTEARLDAGRGTELDTSRAQAQLQTTLATIPPLRASIMSTIYRLSVLTGQLPNALAAELETVQPPPALPRLTAIGTPETLLRRRPDVRVAERQLASATARIGIAVGDLFPRVSFIGSIGYNAGNTRALGEANSETYAFGPSISWAAFDLGRVRSRIGIADAQADAALAAYQSTVLLVLEETEGALITYGHAQSRRATLEQAAAASSKAANLARQRFEGGLTDFLNVLDAERDALSAQDNLAQSRTQTATSLIAIYKALGGGWVSER
jgi:outer membrane protein, multidrug efflux system